LEDEQQKESQKTSKANPKSSSYSFLTSRKVKTITSINARENHTLLVSPLSLRNSRVKHP